MSHLDLLNLSPLNVRSKRNEQSFRNTKKLMSTIDTLEVDGCYLNNFMSNIQLLISDNFSDSVLISANLQDSSKTEVVLKISPSNSKDNGTFVEILIYKELINKLYVGRITPHIMPCLGTFSCNNFVRSLPNYFPKLWLSTIKDKWKYVVKNLQCSPYIAKFLVLQMNYGMSLQKFINEEYNEEILTTLFFQVCYTLHCFNKAGLRHNDLHFENVFVEINQLVQQISYVVEENVAFTVPTHGYIAKIFDFDRAYFAHGIKNTGLMDQERNGGVSNLCNLNGTCNENNPVFDIYYFVRILLTEIPKEGELANSINAIINKSSNRVAIFAKVNEDTKSLFLVAKNGGEYDWRNDDLPTPLEFLQNLSVFDKFRIQNPNPKMPNTFFSDETIRKSFHVRSRPLPSRPIINNNYIMKCIACEWPGKFHSESFNLKDVEEVMHLLLSLSANHDPRQVIAAFDEFLEYLQRYPVKNVGELKLMGCVFLAMNLHLNFTGIQKVFENENFKKIDEISNYKMRFDSKCQSTLEYLLYCENEYVPKSAQKRFKKHIVEVVKHVFKMYADSQYYLMSPMVRAQILMNSILH